MRANGFYLLWSVQYTAGLVAVTGSRSSKYYSTYQTY
jgi:hypothetical protein